MNQQQDAWLRRAAVRSSTLVARGALISSTTPAKRELPLTGILPSATAEAISAERMALSAQSDTTDRELDEGIDYFSAQGALAAYRLGKAEGSVA